MYSRNPFAPPANVDVAERGILGVDYRKIVIFVATLPLALGVIVLWKNGPLYLRGAIGVLIAFAGVALAFGQINGKTPEAWFFDFLAYARRRRLHLHGYVRGMMDARSVRLDMGIEEKAAVQASAATDFFLLTANAIGMAALTGLTLWLYQSGAHGLQLWWNSLSGITSL